ncbi:MAG: hypothetical protein H7841_14490 [Magnetospirillum sp. WYHS-4]
MKTPIEVCCGHGGQDPPPSPVVSERDEKTRRLRLWLDFTYRTLRLSIIAAVIVSLGYMTKEAIAAIAGGDSSLDVVVKWVSDGCGSSVVISFVFGGVAAAWGMLERRERLRLVRKSGARIQELECMIDPRRTSSLLAPDGETHPNDR